MTTPPERWILDTNVWIFGLRRDVNFPACARLLDQIGSFSVIVPRQVLKELAVKLTEQEMRLLNNYPGHAEVRWELAPAERVKFYQEHGCRKGDAVIAAHAEALEASLIVSENRQFLHTMSDMQAEVSSPEASLQRLISD